MSEQNLTTADQATEATAKLYPTRAEAEANKPADAAKSLKPMEVSKNGTVVGWVLGRGYDHALSIVARSQGFTVSTGKTAPVTREQVLAKLSELSDDELAAMGLSRKPQKGGKK